MVSKTLALLCAFKVPKMCTAGKRVSLTITGRGPSFFHTKIYAGQRTQRGHCPIEQRGEFPSVNFYNLNLLKKDGVGPVMVSCTLCPAVHILGSQKVYGRAEGIADHYWPWAVFFAYCT